MIMVKEHGPVRRTVALPTDGGRARAGGTAVGQPRNSQAIAESEANLTEPWEMQVTVRTERDSYGQFRCTNCQSAIPWAIDPAELGIAAGEEARNGGIYPYERCFCGNGKFVVYGGSAVAAEAENAIPSIQTRHKVENARYARLDIDTVRPNPKQPRRFFEAEALRGLAESLKTIGHLEDVLVRPRDDHYELVLGERRWRATRLAGLPQIPAKIVDLDDEEARAISIVENIHRENLTNVEEAFAFKSYVDQGYLLGQVGDNFGGMRDRVADRLKTLNSNYYTKFQAERIGELEQTVEQLQQRLRESGHGRYDAKEVGPDELVDYVRDGFEVAVTMPDGTYVVRRRIS
jgi:ParB/RepB/Spo0J family partition protein